MGSSCRALSEDCQDLMGHPSSPQMVWHLDPACAKLQCSATVTQTITWWKDHNLLLKWILLLLMFVSVCWLLQKCRIALKIIPCTSFIDQPILVLWVPLPFAGIPTLVNRLERGNEVRLAVLQPAKLEISFYIYRIGEYNKPRDISRRGPGRMQSSASLHHSHFWALST